MIDPSDAPLDLPEPDAFALPDWPGEAPDLDSLPDWLQPELPVDARIVPGSQAELVLLPEVPKQYAELTVPPINRPTLTNPPFEYGLVAKISLPRPAFGVRVDHELPDDVQLLGTEPKATVVGRHLMWNLGRLDPGKEIRLKIAVQPDSGARLSARELTSFHATYNQNLHFQTPLVRPRLSCTITAPSDVERGDNITVTVDVMNTGNWPIQDAELTLTLPSNFARPDTPTTQLPLGSLLPTQHQSAVVRTQAIATGAFRIDAKVRSKDRTTADATHTGTVRGALLEIASPNEPRLRVGEPSELRFDVRNAGDAPAQLVTWSVELPSEFEFVSGMECAYDPLTHSVFGGIEHLTVGVRSSWKVTVRPSVPGDVILRTTCGLAIGETIISETPATITFDERRPIRMLEDFLTAMREPMSAMPHRANRTETPTQPVEQFIVFTLAGQEFAVPLAGVLEVGRPPTPTIVPHVPAWIVGVASLRGDIVSLVNLRAFLNLEGSPATGEGRLLVTATQKRDLTVGLIVDRVRGLRAIEPTAITAAEGNLASSLTPYLRGVTESQGRMVAVLDPDRLLGSPQMRQFEIA